ncbi:hypothetical protein ACN47E_000431 [Coniothyrium glycines]
MALSSRDPSSPSGAQIPSSRSSFQYRPLISEEDEDIRLICLYPGSFQDPIRCDVFHTSFASNVSYEALSYTWANEDDDSALSEQIHCAYIGETQHERLAVTKNCAAALRRLRDTSEEKILWIDAIAIDQSNHQERNHQVGLMDQVYINATQVLVYLGEEDLGFTSPGLWLDDRRRRTALEKLFTKRWVTRVWVIQEVALAQKILLIMGPATCPFDEGLSSRIRARARLYNLRVPGPLAWNPMVNTGSDLLSLLDMTRNCHATDSRDKIYGLLGLTSENFRKLIKVDYSQTIEELLIHTAEAIISSQRGLDILVYASSMQKDASSRTTLPTWVPDWSRPSSSRAVRRQLQYISLGPWVSDGVISEKREFDLPDASKLSPSITVRAHWVGKIDGRAYVTGGPTSGWQTAHAFSTQLKKLMNNGVAPSAWPTHLQWLLNPDARGHRSLSAPQTLHWAEKSELQSFCTELDRTEENEHIFRAGYLPVLSDAAFVQGDTVCAVDGCRSFLILRGVDLQPDAYSIVGNCVLLGMMHFDCYDKRGSGGEQQWDFNPFRHLREVDTHIIQLL